MRNPPISAALGWKEKCALTSLTPACLPGAIKDTAVYNVGGLVFFYWKVLNNTDENQSVTSPGSSLKSAQHLNNSFGPQLPCEWGMLHFDLVPTFLWWPSRPSHVANHIQLQMPFSDLPPEEEGKWAGGDASGKTVLTSWKRLAKWIIYVDNVDITYPFL